MIEEDILLLITKEITNEISRDEREILRDWLEESKRNTTIYHSYRESFINGKYEVKAKNSKEAYDRLSRNLGFDSSKSHSIRDFASSGAGIRLPGWLTKVAAILLIFISATVVIYHTRQYWKPGQEDVPENTLVVKSNPRGKKSLITLPDGSKVKLNSESYLEYYSDFDYERTVHLVGEAFFEVKKDSLRPFYVKTGDLGVKVLGTSFNVQAYPFADQIKVALLTGKVMIEKQEGLGLRTLNYLDPMEMLVYEHKTSEQNKSSFAYDETLGWKDGKLVFKEASFNDAVKKLERWYGVDIVIESDREIAGGFNGTYVNAPLEVVLEGMSFSTEFDYEIKGKKVFIR